MAFDPRLLSGLGALLAVVEHGGFARGAEALDVTPSGVSRSIARLEARLGLRLFNRSSRAVSLTDEGRRLHDEVAPLLASLQDAAEGASAASATARGRFRVSADPWFARIVLAPRLPEFIARHPQVSLDLAVTNHVESLVTGGIDVAVRFGQPLDSSLVALKLLDTRVITCAAPAYLERRGTPRHPREIPAHDVLLFRDPQTGRPFPWEFHRRGKVLRPPVSGRVVTDDPSTALVACEAGQGLFQSFLLGLGPWLTARRLVPVLEDWADETFPLFAYYASRRQLPAKVRAFLDFAREICAAPAGGASLPRPVNRGKLARP